MAGASPGKRKFPLVFRIPMISPLMPKISTEGSWIRSSLTVRTCSSGSCRENPGTRMYLTTCSAKMNPSAQRKNRTRNRQFPMREASSQAFSFSSSLSSIALKVGTKALASAPPAIRLKIVSVRRLAAR